MAGRGQGGGEAQAGPEDGVHTDGIADDHARMMATMKSLRLRDFMKGCRAMRRGVMNHEKTATPVSRRIPGRAERLFRTKDGSCRSQLAIVLPSLCRYILLLNVIHSCSSQDTIVFVFCMQKK